MWGCESLGVVSRTRCHAVQACKDWCTRREEGEKGICLRGPMQSQRSGMAVGSATRRKSPGCSRDLQLGVSAARWGGLRHRGNPESRVIFKKTVPNKEVRPGTDNKGQSLFRRARMALTKQLRTTVTFRRARINQRNKGHGRHTETNT